MGKSLIDELYNGLNTNDGKKVKQMFQEKLCGELYEIDSDLNTSNTGIKARVTTLESQIADENKVKIYNTVAEIGTHQTGDIIEVLGYYEKGDGGGHKRKKNNIGSTYEWDVLSDDGFYNVKWFGAKGDNSTNDTLKIQEAITRYSSIFFPTGVFCTDTIMVGSNRVIKGKGLESHLKFVLESENHFIAIRGQNVIIENMFLDGNKARRGGGNFINGATVSIATDTLPTDPKASDLTRTKNIKIRNCFFKSNGFDVIGGWDCSDVKILNNYFFDGRDTCIDFVEGAFNVTIEGNTVYNGSFGTLFMVALDTVEINKYGFVRNFNINNNTFIINDSTGVQTSAVLSLETCKDINVFENTIIASKPLLTGAKIFVDCDNVNVFNNTFLSYDNANYVMCEVNDTANLVPNRNCKIYNNNFIAQKSEIDMSNPTVDTCVGINLYSSRATIENNYFKGVFIGVEVQSLSKDLKDVYIKNNEFNNIKYGIRCQGNYANKTNVYIDKNKYNNVSVFELAGDSGYNIYTDLEGLNYYNGGAKFVEVKDFVEAKSCAKAWVNFNGQGVVSIKSSYNVSSITDIDIGTYAVNYIKNTKDNLYSCVKNSKVVTTYTAKDVQDTNKTTYSVTIITIENNAPKDSDSVDVAIFGN